MPKSPERKNSPQAATAPPEAITQLTSFLNLAEPAAKPQMPKPLGEPQSFPACSPPDVRTPPQFTLPHRRAVLVNQVPVTLGDDTDIPQLRIACVKIRELTLHTGFDLRFDQTWNLLRLGIGDLSSTIGSHH
jgi:hypothetical protein